MEKVTDKLDDVYGAFGALSVKMAVTRFRIYEHIGFPCIEIDKIGIYIRDTYDFIGDDQLLGYWYKNGVLKPGLLAYATKPDFIDVEGKRYFKITNGSFNDHRKHHKKGGDFFAYSKVKKISTSIQLHFDSVDFDEFIAREKS